MVDEKDPGQEGLVRSEEQEREPGLVRSDSEGAPGEPVAPAKDERETPQPIVKEGQPHGTTSIGGVLYPIDDPGGEPIKKHDGVLRGEEAEKARQADEEREKALNPEKEEKASE